MRYILKTIMAVALAVLCQYSYAAGDKYEDSPAVKVLESGRKTKKLEGTTLKIARPILKKTPMSAIMNDIDMMMIYELGKEKKDQAELMSKVERMLKSYVMVKELDDELSHMFIYIDTPQDEKFSELILFTKRPEMTIMLFEGDFKISDLMKVGELSVQDRKERIRARHSD